MNLPIIQVKRSEMFKQHCECFYDVHILEQDNVTTAAALMFKQFVTEQGIRQMFKDGYAPMLLNCEQMQRVELLHQNDQPFLIIVVEQGDVVATVHHQDIMY